MDSWYVILHVLYAVSSPGATIPAMCVNERYLFLLLTGGFMGYTYSLRYFLHNMNCLSFPSVQQFKYLQFRQTVPKLLKLSCVQSLYLTRNFAAVYFFLGYIPRKWIQSVLNLQMDQHLPPLDTVRGLLDLSLFYQIWLSGVFLLTTWYIVWLLFQIYTTEVSRMDVMDGIRWCSYRGLLWTDLM
uniref:Nucleoporin NDC1 n=1 Tax=Engystomops pustulosus TaxID=76066 RepID=A0AAV6Z087_ENGPU|nr:hypothetical protein GDO81_020503 [Engystomops pustulosus]